MDYNYTGKKAIVCGMAKSGISSAKLLKKLGADVTLQDIKPRNDGTLSAACEEAEAAGIELYLGNNPDNIIQNFDLIVVSPGLPCNLPFFEKAEQLGIELIGEIELAYRLCKCKIAAVTGTNGKTTTTALLGEILESYYKNSETVGNIGIPFTDKALDLPETAYASAEISSFMLETAKTFKPHIAVILNITPDHLNRHITMENYASIKARIFANQDNCDYAVINYDDELCRKIAGTVNSKIVFFSRKEVLSKGVYIENECIYASVDNKKDKLLCLADIKIPGAHSVENVLAAAAAAYCAGVPPEKIKHIVTGFKGVEHRIEFVRELDGVKYYNDSKATNTDSAIKALEALSQPLILIGGGKDKSADFTDWVSMFHHHVKHLILIGETSRQIIETCDKLNFKNYRTAGTLKEAVTVSRSCAEKGDCVLLSPACASLDMFKNAEKRGELFKEYVRELY